MTVVGIALIQQRRISTCNQRFAELYQQLARKRGRSSD